MLFDLFEILIYNPFDTLTKTFYRVPAFLINYNFIGDYHYSTLATTSSQRPDVVPVNAIDSASRFHKSSMKYSEYDDGNSSISTMHQGKIRYVYTIRDYVILNKTWHFIIDYYYFFFQHLTTVPHPSLRLSNIHDIIQLCQAAPKKLIRLYQEVSLSIALT